MPDGSINVKITADAAGFTSGSIRQRAIIVSAAS
jgi:hypothetical protein